MDFLDEHLLEEYFKMKGLYASQVTKIMEGLMYE
jgi:hypothetical protein